MMDLDQFIEELKKDESYRGQIVHQEIIPARKASFGRLKRPLPAPLEERLRSQGITKLYTHQAEAIELIRRGKNVIIITGTASGKSLCYNLPVLEGILEDPKISGLYLFPTKALAQDQLRSLREFQLPMVRAATYDGDTPQRERFWVRENANLVLSNPDMLNYGILPHHKRWGDFLLNLRFVVLDEVHTLRGIFGSHMANIIRRLNRICAHYGSKPQFILASATIANPKELAEKLVGKPVEIIDGDGSPQGEKIFLFWNPPPFEEVKGVPGRSHQKRRRDLTGRRKSSNSEATYLFLRLAQKGLRNIVFSKSRQTAELVFRYAQNQISSQFTVQSSEKESPNPEPRTLNPKRLASYRAGYLPKERREIEQRLFQGELFGVSSTNALELGIDIGTLEACVINGFPGTITSTWQQAGRAGRTQKSSLAVLIAQEDPLDQYYMGHPQEFFGKGHEQALIAPENLPILREHLRCAAYEFPLTQEDEKYFGSSFRGIVRELAKEKTLLFRKNRWFWNPLAKGQARRDFPAGKVNIRSASQDTCSIVEAQTGILLGTVDSASAFIYIHPGAIYLHQGDTYLVLELDLREKVALVEPSGGKYYTQPREETDIKVLKEGKQKVLGKTEIFLGEVEVTSHTVSYQKRSTFTGEGLGEEPLELPPEHFRTEAFWFTVPQRIADELRLNQYELAGGIHALEHGAIALLPLFAMCDRWDIGGVSTPLHEHTDEPTIFIYDGYEGGVGIAARGYELGKKYLDKTFKMIRDCRCERGCPSCVQSPKCGNFNEPLDKKAALSLLKKLLK